ncbi:hypothetical protein GWK08_01490 [Leptobacterium flavescens]|uniref:Uncharacterized protein n=1 Tax=Leptobacterium flavescens TaxID=472055 RepID=A0A6P0UHJ7_9FLAO|nr:hypothetical protein [Leptobacterium flavescens]NER12102.1 hypothetical protein [Leptobacterium flavescens]
MSVNNDHIQLTAAQKELFELLNNREIKDYYDALKTVHYLGTYHVRNDMVDLSASRQVQDLLDVIREIAIEHDTIDLEKKTNLV